MQKAIIKCLILLLILAVLDETVNKKSVNKG
jgi:hypothetical protein